ncbi:MAG: acyl-CoA/acyl-ACP dehydrogenase [Calditrichaeota bacterium]|nr:acyl-CoA/acyl-ACP dehydrogenase [Calditrichota bacterium]
MNFELSEQQKLLKEQITKFARNELDDNFSQREQTGVFSLSLWKKCADYGIIGLGFPEADGGSGADALTSLLAFEALSYGSRDSGLVKSMITQVCSGLQLLHFADEKTKRKFLPDIVHGKKIAAQAITESDAGSDVAAMKTSAQKKGDHFLLNGTKMYITNGPIADVVFVMAKTDDNTLAFANFSWLIVEQNFPGFSAGKNMEKMGLRTLLNSEVIFANCPVPETNIVGKRGQGMFIFNEIMEWERLLMSASHLGTLERLLEKTIEYANTRQQFGKAISNYQSVSQKIVQMKMNVELGRLMLYKAGWLKSNGKRAALETTIAKLFISETLKQAAVDALQVHGAFGYMKESEIEQDVRDSFAASIISGTSEIHENIIAQLSGLKIK